MSLDRTVANDNGTHLLDVKDLRVEFDTEEGLVQAVNGVSYWVDAEKTLAIVGESGSGKTVSARAVMGILDTPPGRIAGGSILYKGDNLLAMPEKKQRNIRGRHISMIFQDALTALNPGFTVGFQIVEMFRVHTDMSGQEAKKRAIELLDRVQIPAAAERINDYPHQFSGGMRQRVMIAIALALQPEVVIADEPTTALDVTIQAQIMELLRDLQSEEKMGLILITHDLALVADYADRIAVMYAGRIVESGTTSRVLESPRHPYTMGLRSCVPSSDHRVETLIAIRGAPPSLADIPPGCAFHPRCDYTQEICRSQAPVPLTVGPGHVSTCHFARELMPNE